MWKNHAHTIALHLLLMLVTSLATKCCGMASHSSTSICHKSNYVVVTQQNRCVGHSGTNNTPGLQTIHPLHSQILN